MVPYGFGVGDFISAASLVYQLIQTLRAVSEDTIQFQKVQLALLSFHATLLNLEKVILSGNARLSDEQVLQIKTVLNSCRAPVVKFEDSVKTYIKAGDRRGEDGVYRLKSVRKKIHWSFAGKKKVEPFEREILYYISLLGLNMQSIQQQTLQDLSTQVISLQQTPTSTDVSRSIPRKWDQEPICFQDAVGRKYGLPIEACRAFSGLIAILLSAFSSEKLVRDAINKQAIWLFTPQARHNSKWDLIWESDWEGYVRPGMVLGMSLFAGFGERNPNLYLSDTGGGTFDLDSRVPRCALARRKRKEVEEELDCDDANLSKINQSTSTGGEKSYYISEVDTIRFKNPLPDWAEYDPETEFILKSSRRRYDDDNVIEIADSSELSVTSTNSTLHDPDPEESPESYHYESCIHCCVGIPYSGDSHTVPPEKALCNSCLLFTKI